jgi:hypothetical protein
MRMGAGWRRVRIKVKARRRRAGRKERGEGHLFTA